MAGSNHGLDHPERPGVDEVRPHPARIALELDQVIHVRARLGIMNALSKLGPADFTHLRRILAMNDGTLSVHLRKLEVVGYIWIRKDFVGRKPRTRCSLTRKGRTAFRVYLTQLGTLIAHVR